MELWGSIEKKEKDLQKILLAIYKEVQELGPRKKEDFIKREFHLNLDGSWDNREEHVVVLCYKEGSGEKMILQVTYFEGKLQNGSSRLSLITQEITTLVVGDCLNITHTTFPQDEQNKILPEILIGIRSEKKLLRSLKSDFY